MFPYWLLFFYFAVGALTARIRPDLAARKPMLAVGAVIIALMIGLRFEVGADWRSYEFMFYWASRNDLGRAIEIGDPGYQFVNWAIAALGGDVWHVNLLSGAVFAWGLHRLARNQPSPWLAMTVAVPYLVIVVAMGYTRQAIAIGILMAGFAQLERGMSVIRFSLFVLVAALFHRTAVVVLPIVIFSGTRNRTLNIIAGIAASVALFDAFLADSMDDFVQNYVEAEYQSQGAAIRVAMNLVPAAIMLLAGKRLGFTLQEERLWRYFSLAAFALLVALIVSPSSTAVDRIALYVLPLQVVVLSRLFLLMRNWTAGRLVIIFYAFAIQFTWLNFAEHAEAWLPYQTVLADDGRPNR